MDESANKDQNYEKKRKIILIFLVVLIIGIVAYLCRKIIPDLIRVLETGDEGQIEAYIRGAGTQGVFFLVLLQVLQTVTIFFPGIPIYMASGIIYGKLYGTIICYITYVLANTGIFFVVHKMKRSIQTNKGKKEDQKQNKLIGILRNTDHPVILTMALCVIPLIPNGMVPYISAATGMSLKDFFKAVAMGCLPGIFLFVFCGDLLMSKYFKTVIALMVAAIVIMVLTFVLKDKIFDWFVSRFGEKEDTEA